MIKTIRNAVVGGIAIAAFALPAAATSFDKAALEAHVDNASACIVGQVVNIEYEQRGPFVYTMATVQVSDTAFGNTASTITVLVPGGPIPNAKIPVAQVVAGAPRVRTGQKFLFVLDAAEQTNEYTISGFSEGAINIVSTSAGPRVPQAGSDGLITVDAAIESILASRNGSVQ